MICKTVEIRDVATFIPALAIRLVPACERDRYLLGRAGYTPDPRRQAEYVILTRIAGGTGEATSDPYEWNSSTMREAHAWLIEHFDEIESGVVVDVEFITGKRATPKRSEQETAPF